MSEDQIWALIKEFEEQHAFGSNDRALLFNLIAQRFVPREAVEASEQDRRRWISENADLGEQVARLMGAAHAAVTQRDAALGVATSLREALDALTYATWVVLCEYGSAGVPMIERMAAAADAAKLVLKATGTGTGAPDEP